MLLHDLSNRIFHDGLDDLPTILLPSCQSLRELPGLFSRNLAWERRLIRIDNRLHERGARVVERFAIPRAIPDALVEGLEWDATGRTYETPEEFKRLLLADLDTFNATFIEKLATYGLRRSISFGDRDGLAAIAQASKAKDYRLRDLIEAFVLSDLFARR